MDQGVCDQALRPLVEAFYEQVRRDPLLGPIFAEAVDDWNDHHGRLTDFWSSVMMASGRYKGGPAALHLRLADLLTPERFDRWLDLWNATTSERLPSPTAAVRQARASRIAERLQLSIHRARRVI